MKKYKKVYIKIPARFHFDVMNIHKLIEGQTGGGGIGLAVNCYFKVYAHEINRPNDIIDCSKPKLAEHYIKLLRKFLGTNKRFYIKCTQTKLLKNHNGMGLNTLFQVGISYAINNLIENPIEESRLIEFLKKNYYEEENGIVTKDVFCTGVAHNTSINGGICFVSEDANLIYSKKVLNNIVVGAIKIKLDSEIYSRKLDNDKVIVKLRKQQVSIKNKKQIIESIINDLKNNNYASFFEGMKMFSKSDDSIAISKMCKVNDLRYTDLCEIIEEISDSIVRISSNAPYLYVLTTDFINVKKICRKNKIEIKKYKIDNEGIKVVVR